MANNLKLYIEQQKIVDYDVTQDGHKYKDK